MERPDQTCFLCKQPITNSKWTVIQEKAYHNECMQCGTCKRRVGFDRFCIRENMAFCRDCDQDAVNAKADVAPWNHDAQARQCSICKSTAVGQRLLRAGRVYCPHCYRCYHCQLPMGNDNCLLLLDRLYCFGCEQEYNTQRFLLAKCGSGPLVLTML